MTTFPEFEELRALLDALWEERISPAEVKRLEQLVLERPEAEAYYVQSMSLFADVAQTFSTSRELTERALRQRVANGLADSANLPIPRRGSWWTMPRRLFAGVAAVAVVAAGILSLLAPWKPPIWKPERVHMLADDPVEHPARSTGAEQHPDDAESYDNSIAVLVAESSAEWEPGDLPTSAGSTLTPGRLRLKSGFAQIEFYSGATIVLEGPSDFEIISPMEAFCSRGKLRASVPPHAQGFTIGSPKVDLIDRGTEFGMKVDSKTGTEVHVFQGKVELYQAGAAKTSEPQRALTTGQAVRVERSEQASAIESDVASFLSAEELAERTNADARRRQRLWQARSEERRRDRDLVVYYNFQPDDLWSRDLANQVEGRPADSDGTIVGCNWVTGRWPGKYALDFHQVSDRVRLNVPGEFDALTAALWIRIDALPHRFNSLLMADSWDEFEGHWHIDSKGRLELGVQGPNRKNFVHYFATSQFEKSLLGKWAHLALVYDRSSLRVMHYLDGEEIGNVPISLDVPLRLGACDLGNWNTTERPHTNPIRFLTGRIDEFMLYARALSGEEIAELANEAP